MQKIVRTETAQQRVELKREEIVVERVPPSGSQAIAFQQVVPVYLRTFVRLFLIQKLLVLGVC